MRAVTRQLAVLHLVVFTLAMASAAGPGPAAGAEPTASRPEGDERVDLRTTSSRTFELSDGRMLTQLFDRPIFYRPTGAARWEPVDTRLRPTNDGSAVLAADRSPSALTLEPADSASGFMRLRGGGYTISIGLPEGTREGRARALPESREEGRYAEYRDFLPGGVGLRVFPHSDGQKMFLVLNSRPSTTQFTFTLDAPGLRLGPDPLGTPAPSP